MTSDSGREKQLCQTTEPSQQEQVKKKRRKENRNKITKTTKILFQAIKNYQSNQNLRG